MNINTTNKTTNNVETPEIQVSELDFTELLQVIFKGKWIIIASTLIASIIAVYIALSLPNVYRAEATVSPISSEDSGLGGLASQFGGLASLAGVSLSGSGGVDKPTLGMEILKSRKFFADFAQKYDVLIPLMAANNWDSVNNVLSIDPDIYDTETATWTRVTKAPRKPKPSYQEAYEVYIENLSVVEDKETGFITISYEHYSPYIAKKWVDLIIFEINENVRNMDLSLAQRSINYLETQIQNTSLAELKLGFFEMIQSQTKTMMLANAMPEYLFQTIDPALVPELKAKPKRALLCVIGAFLGGVLGIVIVMLRYLFITGKN